MNFRQYNRPQAVQAAQITEVPDAMQDAVRVRDNSGMDSVIACHGLFSDNVDSKTGQKIPVAGDWLLLWPTGKTTWVSAAAWAEDEWEPVRGPVLG